MTADELVRRARALLSSAERSILGIAGGPGSGKTTLAIELVERLNASGPVAVHVPMDGFHLADAELLRLGRRDRKGAPDTFDGWGYVNLLARCRANAEPEIYAPAFDREVGEPVAGSIRVDRSVRLVVTEGNYLLVDEPPWRAVAAQLSETWFCEVSESVRLARLVARHREFGMDAEHARAWAGGPDQRNAETVAGTACRASLIVDGAMALAGRRA